MTKKLSTKEKEIIIGTILGDGHFAMLKTDARLEVGHSHKQKDYVFWKYKQLPDIVGAEPHKVLIDDARYGKTWEQWSFSTRINPELTELRDMFYKGKKKIIPKNIGLLLTSPLSLAVWFMD